MADFVYPNFRDGYVDLCRHVLAFGRRTAPRGQTTYELLGATLEVWDLRDTLPVGVGRGLSLEVAALEALQLIGEVSRPDLLVACTPRFADFQEPDGTFHGAYGLRAQGQTSRALQRLRDDSASRQALVTLWDPARDSHEVFRDLPCTVVLQLLVRDARLHLQVFMRSNDVWLGLAYDYFVFSQWLWTCARVLGLEPGTYTHHVGSLHAYERDAERIEELHAPDRDRDWLSGLDTSAAGPLHGDVRSTWERVRLQAVHLLDDPETVTVNRPTEVWYREQLLRVYDKLLGRTRDD